MRAVQSNIPVMRLPPFTKGALAAVLLLVCSSSISQQQERGASADMSNAPRVMIDRPKPTFMLRDRDARVHGLKPLQELVDNAPVGSVLKPPPGNYSGPVVIDKPLTIDGGGKVVDVVHLENQLVHHGFIQNRIYNQVKPLVALNGCHVDQFPRPQVINGEHLVVHGHKPFGQVRPDKAGASGNQCLHAPILSLIAFH